MPESKPPPREPKRSHLATEVEALESLEDRRVPEETADALSEKLDAPGTDATQTSDETRD